MKGGMRLSNWTAFGLFVWFLVVAFLSSYLLYGELTGEKFSAHVATNVFGDALRMSALSAAAASSVFYIRKLYKDLFYQTQKDQAVRSSELATFMYFSVRPLFAVLFAVFIVVSSSAFIHSVTAHGTALSSGFVLYSVIFSCLAAIVTGRTLSHIEAIATDSINRITGA